jgi:hypothetical protein
MKLPNRWVIVGIGALMTCVGIGAMAVALAIPPLPLRSHNALQSA